MNSMVLLMQKRKEVQSHVPLSDAICCFTSDDEEMAHAPTKKCKRPFREINLDLKAGEHGSLEDQRRRNSGPPQPRNLHTLQMEQGKEHEQSGDAARLRVSADTDPTKNSDFKKKVCPTIRENDTKQLLAAQQITLCPEETNKQTKSNGGFGVITLFDGVSSVVPRLTKKFGCAPTVAILVENDIDIRAVVCAEFGYRADDPTRKCGPLSQSCTFVDCCQVPDP